MKRSHARNQLPLRRSPLSVSPVAHALSAPQSS